MSSLILLASANDVRVAVLERRRVVERGDLLADRLDDLAPSVAEPAAPQPRQAVEDLLAVGVGVVRALGGDDHARVRLELAVAGERHPVRVEPGRIRPGEFLVFACVSWHPFPALSTLEPVEVCACAIVRRVHLPRHDRAASRSARSRSRRDRASRSSRSSCDPRCRGTQTCPRCCRRALSRHRSRSTAASTSSAMWRS